MLHYPRAALPKGRCSRGPLEVVMKKENESRRTFLKGAAAGASAGAVAAFIPAANAQSGNAAQADSPIGSLRREGTMPRVDTGQFEIY